eukprot:SAG11_NODE_48567_length_122_cov_1411.130435_1_plen_40_part_11
MYHEDRRIIWLPLINSSLRPLKSGDGACAADRWTRWRTRR